MINEKKEKIVLIIAQIYVVLTIVAFVYAIFFVSSAQDIILLSAFILVISFPFLFVFITFKYKITRMQRILCYINWHYSENPQRDVWTTCEWCNRRFFNEKVEPY